MRHLKASDLRAGVQLATEATKGVIGIAEGVHQAVLRTVGGRSAGQPGRTTGVTGLVYRSVRATTHLVGRGLDLALAKFLPLVAPGAMDRPVDSPEREAVLSALNGVLGDHLATTGNALALPMQLRWQGRPLAQGWPDLIQPGAVTGHGVVLVHGLCMNDRQWTRQGHDHGAFLASVLGATPLYLRYNSGLHVSDNGEQLAALLEDMAARWPVPLHTLSLVGHSMGGLVARSAHHAAIRAGHTWPGRLKHLVCLGTPHHGAPLERAGVWVDELLGHTPLVSRFTAPFAKLGQVRSAGITDLRHGDLLATDWQGRERFRRRADGRTPVPLPQGVGCFTVAATLAGRRSLLAERLTGDGLVPLNSALGLHDDPRRTLAFPRDRQLVLYGTGHLALLGSPVVARQLVVWLGS
jgi:hypothetical protein